MDFPYVKFPSFGHQTPTFNISSMGTTRQLYGKAMEEGLVTFGESNAWQFNAVGVFF